VVLLVMLEVEDRLGVEYGFAAMIPKLIERPRYIFSAARLVSCRPPALLVMLLNPNFPPLYKQFVS
jgi:hypothetical protein